MNQIQNYELIQEQQRLESRAALYAQEKARDREKQLISQGSFTSTKYGSEVFTNHIHNVGLEIAETLNEKLSVNSPRAATRRLEWLQQMLEMSQPGDSYDVLAAISVRTVLNQMIQSNLEDDEHVPVARVVAALGVTAKEQGTDVFLQVTCPAEYEELAVLFDPDHERNRIQNKSYQNYNRQRAYRILQEHLDAARVDSRMLQWNDHVLVEVGHVLLNCVLRGAPGLFLHMERDGDPWDPRYKHRLSTLAPSTALLQEYKGALENCRFKRLNSRPLVAPPKPWEDQPGASVNNHSGGLWLDGTKEGLGLVRGFEADALTHISPDAIEFANRLGATPFVGDSLVFDAFEWAVDHRQDVDGLALPPAMTAAELDSEKTAWRGMQETSGSHPLGLDTLTTEELREWKRHRRTQYVDAIEATKKSMRTLHILQEGREIMQLPEMYSAWSYDYRARIYPTQMILGQQSGEAERAMTMLRDGEPLTPSGVRELKAAIGRAALGDADPHQDRIDWTDRNWNLLMEMIDLRADDIYSITNFLPDADEPWTLLALLQEAKRWSLNPKHVVRHMVDADATNSGNQFLGATMRCRETCINTNVILQDPNQGDKGKVDAYRILIDKTAELILEASQLVWEPASDGRYRLMNPEAAPQLLSIAKPTWIRNAISDPMVMKTVLQLVQHPKRRTLGKAALLVRVYGATHRSIRPSMEKAVAKLHAGLSSEMLSKVAAFLTNWTNKATEISFGRSMFALDWMRRLAKISISKQLDAGIEHPTLRWVLSDGTEVEYRVSKPKEKRVEVIGAGRVRVAIEGIQEFVEPDTAAAFAPGWVHSLDGLLLREVGKIFPHDCSVIHDCVRCHPNHMAELRDAVKEAFIKVIEDNPIRDLAAYNGVDLDELPELPYGDVDLQSEVPHAVHLFT